MFNLFKNKKRYKDLTLDIASIANFLLNDSGSDLPNPLKESLDSLKLDYSLESLRYVDSYLNEIRKNRKTFTDEQLVKVVLRCGAYCGEVVRKRSKKSLYWIDYDTAIIADPRVKSFDKSIYTFYILFAEPMDFSFPLAKVGKYLDNGSEDSLYAFALAVGDLKK